MKRNNKTKIIGTIVIVIFLGAIGWFFFSPGTPSTEIPSYVSAETTEVYEWAKTQEGNDILEYIPCYCGCKFEGHLHTRHCFWTDEGEFDKHGITCSVCLDIAKKSKELNEQGVDLCEIRKTIDDFYAPNAHLGTETPYPPNCE